MKTTNQMKVLILIIIGSLAIASCTPASVSSRAASIPDFSDLEITLERGMCLGTCPVNKLQIEGKGEGIYRGEYYVSIKGEQTFDVTHEQVQALLDAFEKAEFYSLNDSYVAAGTEGAINKVSISYQGEIKTVMHFGDCVTPVPNPTPGEPELMMNEGGAPQSLCELENEIDKIVNSGQWVGKMQ